MARAYASFEAGSGDSVLLGEGGRGVHRWISEVDAALDSPYPALAAARPIHAPHPDAAQFPGTVVVGYSGGEHLNDLTWEMFVHYGPITDEILGQWFRSGSIGHETRQLEYSLEVKTENGQFVATPSRLIAQPAYEIIDRRATPNRVAVAKTDSDFGDPYELAYKGYYLAEPEPVTIPIGPKSYVINVRQLSAWKIALITRWLGRTNSLPFILSEGKYAYEQWELMFDGFEHSDFPLAFGGGGRSGVATWWTRATIHLLHRPIHPVHAPFGWRGVRRFHKLVDPATGQQRRVLNLQPLAGNPNDPVNTDIWDGFTTKEDMNFNTLFATVGGFPPNF